jgi:gliding motility-associated protein GldM
MYLVLTALLALNVSSEILTAFKTLNTSLVNANSTFEDKNGKLFSSINERLNDERTRIQAVIWAPKADSVRQLSDEMYNYLAGLQDRIRIEAGYNPAKKDSKYREDNLEAATYVMEKQKQGDSLFNKLKDYRAAILKIDPAIDSIFKNTLPIDLITPDVENKTNNSWWAAYFRMTPAVAAITILSKFQNDVRSTESQVVEYCYNRITGVQVVYDAFQAIATSNSQYLLPGQELTISAGVGAFNKSAKPVVTVDGQNVPIGANGLAEYKTTVGGAGAYTRKVSISYTKPDGTSETKNVNVQYTVGSPTGVIVSADAVKVLYIGLDNPVTISGANGKGAESVQASISQGTITSKGGGKYSVRVTTPGTATISVTSEGKTYPQEFRVKTVPPPIAMVGVSKGGKMSTNSFKAQAGVRAVLENFIFEGVTFTVTSYTMTFAGAGYDGFKFRQVNGNSFNPIRDLIEQARPGSTITIDDIKASGPGGTQTLVPIAFNLY